MSKKSYIDQIKKKLRKSFHKTKFIYIEKINKNLYKFSNSQSQIKLKINGEHNFHNAACAASVLACFGYEPGNISKKLESFEGVSSRLKLHKLENDIHIIDDCYNANPNSFKAAIDYLSSLDQKKLVLMGDMVELGNDAKLFHTEIGKYAKLMGIDEFLSIGKNSKFASKAFGLNRPSFRG